MLRPDWAIMFCSWVRLLQYLSFNSQVWMGTWRLAIPYLTTPFLYEKFLSVLSFHWFTVLLSVQVSNSVPSMDKRDTIANSMLVLIITLQIRKGFLCANEVTLTTKKEHWNFFFIFTNRMVMTSPCKRLNIFNIKINLTQGASYLWGLAELINLVLLG